MFPTCTTSEKNGTTKYYCTRQEHKKKEKNIDGCKFKIVSIEDSVHCAWENKREKRKMQSVP